MMTAGEAAAVFDSGDFMDENGFILGVNLSGEDIPPEDYTAVTEGVCKIKAELSPRVVLRDYVDGDKAVILSRRVKITAELLIISGSDMQRRIFAAARVCTPLRCAYLSKEGVLFEGDMLVCIESVERGSVYGMTARAVFLPC